MIMDRRRIETTRVRFAHTPRRRTACAAKRTQVQRGLDSRRQSSYSSAKRGPAFVHRELRRHPTRPAFCSYSFLHAPLESTRFVSCAADGFIVACPLR